MKKCWANSLRNCSNRISGEHIFSDSIFINKAISVKGFDWCKEEFKKVGLNSLTRNVLCKKHNSMLSPLDSEAKVFADSLRKFEKINSIRNSKTPTNPTVIKYEVNGYLIERWFLKTLINVSIMGDSPIGEESTISGRPSKRLVDIAFGEQEFRKHEGLYIIENQDFIIKGGELYKVNTVFDGEKCVIGGIFEFRGFLFFLSIKNFHIFDFLMFTGKSDNPLSGSIPVHHLKHLDALTKRRVLSQRIIFKW